MFIGFLRMLFVFNIGDDGGVVIIGEIVGVLVGFGFLLVFVFFFGIGLDEVFVFIGDDIFRLVNRGDKSFLGLFGFFRLLFRVILFCL